MALVAEAIKLGYDGAVAALASTVALGMVGSGACLVVAPEAADVTEDRGLHDRSLVSIVLHGDIKFQKPDLL